jgi:DNA-binding MarR family transcriptional regulator
MYIRNLSAMLSSREMRGEGGHRTDDDPRAADVTDVSAHHAGARADLPQPPTAQSVGFTMSSLGFAIAHRFTETLAPLGLEPKEFALMRAVSVAEGQTQQAIAAGLQIPASRMVALVDTLEERGIVERRHNPRDRRARELYLTSSGAELLGEAFARASALEQEICAGMSAVERDQLLELLQRVGAALGVAPGVHAATRTLADSPS